MPYFLVKQLRSGEEQLTLVDRQGFATRAAAEAALVNRRATAGLVVALAVVEAATATEALNQAASADPDADPVATAPASPLA